MDDVFLLWTGAEYELDQFMEYLNTRHELLKFTITKDQQIVQYLDVVVEKGDNLNTRLFTKTMEINNILELNSFHTP